MKVMLGVIVLLIMAFGKQKTISMNSEHLKSELSLLTVTVPDYSVPDLTTYINIQD